MDNSSGKIKTRRAFAAAGLTPEKCFVLLCNLRCASPPTRMRVMMMAVMNVILHRLKTTNGSELGQQISATTQAHFSMPLIGFLHREPGAIRSAGALGRPPV